MDLLQSVVLFTPTNTHSTTAHSDWAYLLEEINNSVNNNHIWTDFLTDSGRVAISAFQGVVELLGGNGGGRGLNGVEREYL